MCLGYEVQLFQVLEFSLGANVLECFPCSGFILGSYRSVHFIRFNCQFHFIRSDDQFHLIS